MQPKQQADWLIPHLTAIAFYMLALPICLLIAHYNIPLVVFIPIAEISSVQLGFTVTPIVALITAMSLHAFYCVISGLLILSNNIHSFLKQHSHEGEFVIEYLRPFGNSLKNGLAYLLSAPGNLISYAAQCLTSATQALFGAHKPVIEAQDSPQSAGVDFAATVPTTNISTNDTNSYQANRLDNTVDPVRFTPTTTATSANSPISNSAHKLVFGF